MQVAKWGKSLAIRLPATVVQALQLSEGDDIQVRITSDRELLIQRDPARQEALERLRRLQRSLPADFTFDRSAAHDR